jgi:hypothetical protein
VTALVGNPIAFRLTTRWIIQERRALGVDRPAAGDGDAFVEDPPWQR